MTAKNRACTHLCRGWLYGLLLVATHLWNSATPVYAQSFPRLSVSVTELSGFNSNDRAKLDSALVLLAEVLNSEEFRMGVIHFQMPESLRTSGPLVERFHMNQGLTNPQILEKIQAARETYSDHDDFTVDLTLTLYRKRWRPWSTVGHTYPGSPRIYLNRNYFEIFTIAEIASNLAHEWCHKLGFEHEFKNTALRKYSVPYGIGELVLKLGENLSSRSF